MVDLSRRSMLTGSWRNASNGILPPWARETTYFLAHCLRCDACIQRVRPTSCSEGGGYPSVDFKRGECSFCYACAQACTESLFLPRHTGPGSDFYAHGKLPRQQSVECHRCRDSCEPMAITFRPTLSGIYQPQLDSQACNGCGACVAICPVSAIKAENHHAH